MPSVLSTISENHLGWKNLDSLFNFGLQAKASLERSGRGVMPLPWEGLKMSMESTAALRGGAHPPSKQRQMNATTKKSRTPPALT